MFSNRPVSAPHAIGDETRAALIAAATEVFLEEGFKAARVSDIAARAGVRLSAINYHYGSKQGLYFAALQHHAEIAIARTPLQAPDANLPLRARFEFFVQAFVHRMLDENSPSRLAPLLVREMQNPTEALDLMFERFAQPQSLILFGLLREILGANTPQKQLTRAALSILGQCMVYRTARPMAQRFQPDLYEQDDMLEALTRHISAFSWAGLQAMTTELEQEKTEQEKSRKKGKAK